MISNQSLRAPGLASFCFLTTSKSEKETIFLIVIIVARVGASLSLSLSLSLSPHSRAGCKCHAEVATGHGRRVQPSVHQPEPAKARGKDASLSEARMEPRQKQGGWAEEPGLVHWGRGGGGPWVGAGAFRERPSGHRSHGGGESQCEMGTRTEWLWHRGHWRQSWWSDSAD